MPQLPRAVKELPLCGSHYMHLHIYLILLLRADTIQGEHLPCLWPLLRFHLGVLLQRRPRLQSQESPPEHLGIHRSQESNASNGARFGVETKELQPLPTLGKASDLRPWRFTSLSLASLWEGNSNCRSRAFHVEAYFDHSILRQQPELRDSYRLLERCHLVPFMTPPQFFYPRVALDFYQSMTTHGVPVPASILFTIDGRQGILGARQIVEAFHIPFAPADPAAFRRWAPLSEWDMVRILSGGTSSQRIIMRKELPPGMLLVDVVLRANLFPLQHRVQRRGAILEALFRISEGYYFGPHHLIMAALLYFEEKMHTRCLTRADTILLLFPRLLCHVLAHMGFPADPHSEHHRHCRESFSLDQWNQVWLHQHSPELPEPREVPPAPSTSAPSEPVPEAASSDAPPDVPPTSKSPITIPGTEYHALLVSFLTLTTTQTAIMERMDHFQLRQDQQTLILHEIQQHLGLLRPAPPVAVPSTVAAEHPSYPLEEPTT
uniref:Uncharacterized protein n=1 Tax=Vitis vinifera TaxID=29760 RepID=A5ARN6_VITVI|nr:hypothetical protein VITISV_028127 [Vitis vinifera]